MTMMARTRIPTHPKTLSHCTSRISTLSHRQGINDVVAALLAFEIQKNNSDGGRSTYKNTTSERHKSPET